MEEAVGLAEAIRLDVVRAEIASIARPRPSSLLGSGTVENLGELIGENDVGLVVSVVVGVVVVVVLRGSCTLVRGTQVYAGSGTKPGGTTSVAGACTGCGAGLYS